MVSLSLHHDHYIVISNFIKIAIEYDQTTRQSQTADKPMTLRERATQQS